MGENGLVQDGLLRFLLFNKRSFCIFVHFGAIFLGFGLQTVQFRQNPNDFLVNLKFLVGEEVLSGESGQLILVC